MTNRNSDYSWNIDGGIHEIPLPAVRGRLWLCGKHRVAPDPDATLASITADTVVCLTEAHELVDRYPSYVDWLEAASTARAVWFPIHDLHAPNLSDARPFYDDLVMRLRNGDTLLVHCAAGIGRAGTTAVAILQLLGADLEDALATVATHRPMAGPEGGAQRELVQQLAASLRTP